MNEINKINKIITSLIEKKIEEKEKELNISDLTKAKFAKFIIDLLFNDWTTPCFKTKLEIIYEKHHEYNTHPYTYIGELSVDKIWVHLINQDTDILLKIINKLTKDYE